MLAPVTHPWRGGVGWYNKLVTMPLIGPLLAYTITLPLGLFLARPGARNVFWPQMMPDGFVRETATPLLLRPRTFLANARDLVRLKQAVIEQVPRYGEIKLPITLISGDADKTVSTALHSRAFARAVPHSKLVVLKGVGHMVQQAAPEVVLVEIEAMMGDIGPGKGALSAVPKASE
jgi:pimeloyl-ACP methyl ester carboxylesterase